jgi:hypothetical protein
MIGMLERCAKELYEAPESLNAMLSAEVFCCLAEKSSFLALTVLQKIIFSCVLPDLVQGRVEKKNGFVQTIILVIIRI